MVGLAILAAVKAERQPSARHVWARASQRHAWPVRLTVRLSRQRHGAWRCKTKRLASSPTGSAPRRPSGWAQHICGRLH